MQRHAKGALAGLRVLDFSSAIAMPMCAMMMGDLGAEVIRVESHTRIRDRVWGALLTGIFPENKPSELYWEESANFHLLHRSKLGVTLDLKKPGAVELARRLAEKSDVVIENNRPGIMARLGLGYDELKRRNPGLIMLSNSGFGITGPWRDYPGLASMLEPLTGLAYAAGYDDDTPPERIGNAYIDYLSAWSGLSAILAAIHYRRRTGKGQHINLSMLQVGMHTVVEPLLDYQLTGQQTRRRGNRHRWMAPHAVYPCAGDDRWLAICVRSDAEWGRFCDLAGHPEWAEDPRFADGLSRYDHQAELDPLIAAWTEPQDDRELMGRLQRAGIPAGLVATPQDLLTDPHLRDRGFYELVDHPGAPRVGRRPIQGEPFKLSATPAFIRKPAPTLGEDNRRVFGELLGLSADELRRLEAEGVIGQEPDPSQRQGPPDVLSIEEQIDLGMIRSYDSEYQQRLGIVTRAEGTEPSRAQ